jgi:hypothetical protein
VTLTRSFHPQAITSTTARPSQPDASSNCSRCAARGRGGLAVRPAVRAYSSREWRIRLLQKRSLLPHRCIIYVAPDLISSLPTDGHRDTSAAQRQHLGPLGKSGRSEARASNRTGVARRHQLSTVSHRKPFEYEAPDRTFSLFCWLDKTTVQLLITGVAATYLHDNPTLLQYHSPRPERARVSAT